MSHGLIPRSHLFGNPYKFSGKISPDGLFLAWLAPLDGVLNVWIAPIDAIDRAEPVTKDTNRGIRTFEWANDGHHLVYMQDKEGDENFHIYAVDTETRAIRDLTPFDGVTAWIDRVSRTIRDRILVRINRRDPKFHDLYTVELASGDIALIQENFGVAAFVTDHHYNVHLAIRDLPSGEREVLRRVDGVWTPWITFATEDARVSHPLHLDTHARMLFLRDSRGRDKAGLTRVDLATGETALLAESDKADIFGVLCDLETREPIAYSVVHERLQYFALEAKLQADLDFLAAQDIGDWFLLSRTLDDRLWVIGAYSDTQPFIEYLFDRGTRSLRELHRVYPELDDAPLLPMRPLIIKSRDGLDLVTYLTLPGDVSAAAPGAAVLLVHGGPWARDSFGYHSLHQWLANRGYAVLSVNFRGSAGFGKAFINAGDGEWGRRMDDDLLDAVAWAIERRIADPQRIAIMGGSYGGYATLVGLTRNPDTYACGVDIVGPSNLETLVRTIPPYWESFRAPLTKAVGDPETEEGLRLLRERSPLFNADKIAKPLLIAHGANDPRVKQAEADQMVEALKERNIPVPYLLFPDEGHGCVRPENNIALFAIVENFLARHLGGLAEPIHADELKKSSLEIREGAEQLSLPQ
ncbi:peptidase S9 prolyl oligopeptidase active site domain protein [Methylocella silvestris BL2]|uniref:Peptidase S9 prolyl oligopeptidase active site domain protein n=1 Tax=Methylocella silvestris (strain DSM 15510 / CIP 108128 / LMG 27833 / NCIMB 13906 / BL2) TaxID=395965 RepID=B8ENP5_METSB|nr:S9 family peptidase [Methylocella silvestris]ACK50831.1 peptidase S9 prolyl oligopeptidase active site domain protein [Methylocella silvestris BL2]